MIKTIRVQPTGERTEERTFVGETLIHWGDTIQVMSDVWESGIRVIAWDMNENRIRYIDLVNWGGVSYEVVDDATPEVLAQYKVWRKRVEKDRIESQVYAESRVIRVGDPVKVVKGKTAVGVTGEVFKIITRPYKMGWKTVERQKLGIKQSDEMVPFYTPDGRVYQNYKDAVWVWAHNAEKNPIVPTMTPEEIEAEAERVTENIIRNRRFVR